MVSSMRIGELLIEQGKLRANDLTRALADKPADRRTGSYLIAKGLVEFDDVARALGELKGVPCALSKHLAGRDPDLAKLIPAELGRASCVLPIGRSSRGAIIVCARDPAPALLRTVEQAIKGLVLMVIAPATRLEHLVAEAYGKASADELDIDFDLANELPAPTPSRVTRGPLETPPMPFDRVDPASLGLAIDPSQIAVGTEPPRPFVRADTPAPLPPLPDMGALDPESIRLSLTDLDDVRVTKDPQQSGQIPILGRTVTAPPQQPPAKPTTTPPPLRSLPAKPKPMTIDDLRASLDGAANRGEATDVAVSYIAQRWVAGLVLAIRDRTAIGYRGHRVTAPESVTVSLGSPSTVQRAVQTRVVSVETPNGVGQSALAHALNGARAPAAAPIVVDGQAVAVIAVADPIEGPDARDAAAADLAILAEALGTAYRRIMAR
jgi:hypothetical protein